MPAPIDPSVRAAVVEAIRDGVLSRAAIGRAHGVAAATVGNIARAEGLVDAFDRSKTAAATEAAKVDNASRRAALETRLLELATRETDTWDSTVVWGNFGGRDNTYAEVTLPQRTDAMKAQLAATIQRLCKTAADLADNSGGVHDRTRSLLEQLAEGPAA